ncbi:phosphoprotein [Clerodendrum chlorotic spot virus]|uniref:Phosphoprotein n=1 Tax=Clerodendrum chlorotic spot virus TaxID=1064520 RepID=A0A2U9Q3C8_9RHAB|nr:phosphoprotein [Clerodendrum chlorotic spot virus]AWT62661.1 phosphoprotein [Clerodendrum chlorotic spot virus]AWT62673.1 phosphoprotein [Clerodendrum chlorotic spot virus]
MAHIGSTTSLYPDIPNMSQVQQDLDNQTMNDPVDAFLSKWPVLGITPPLSLSSKIKTLISKKYAGKNVILDEFTTDLCCLVWNVSSEHHHLINKSQVNKMSQLIDQLSEMMRDQPPAPSVDLSPPKPPVKRKATTNDGETDIQNLIADAWTPGRASNWSKKPISEHFESLVWLLKDHLKLVTKDFSEEWVKKQDLPNLLGDITVFCYINRGTQTEEQLETIRAIVVDRMNKKKKRCLD